MEGDDDVKVRIVGTLVALASLVMVVRAEASTAPPPPINFETVMILKAFKGTGVGWQAVRVARCESQLNAKAVNGQYHGLFQLSTSIRQRVRELTGWNDVSFTVWENARAARYVWSGRGWGAWTCQP